MSHLMELRDLEVRYAGSRAVDAVSLHLDVGEVVALVGANGAGKSSTLKAILGLVGAHHGQLLLDDRDISALATRARVAAGIALSPEGRRVFQAMTVGENLLVGYTHGKFIEQVERRALLEQKFPILFDRRNQIAGTLSGGEQQILAIARALMSNPRVLMLDEPTLGLAPLMVKQVKDLILGLKKQGMSILLAEQNVEMSLSVSDRTYVLENGRVAMDGVSALLAGDQAVRSAYLGL
jgi:branched-chain amino acid transport system ATP-binding protein